MKKTIKYNPDKTLKSILDKIKKGKEINTGDRLFLISFSRSHKSKKDK